MFAAALILGFGGQGPSLRPEVTYSFESQKDFISDELIPANTLVHLTGEFGNVDRRFVLWINGQMVQTSLFTHRFNFDWDAGKCSGDSAHFELDWAKPGENADLFARFDLHLFRTKVQSFETDINASGGLDIRWRDQVPTPGSYAEVLFDGISRGAVGSGGKVTLPRKIATPGMHALRCVLHLPHDLAVETPISHVEVPVPAWLTVTNNDLTWTVSSSDPADLPSGTLNVEPAIRAEPKRLYVDHVSVPLEGTAHELRWRIPARLIHEGQVTVSVELADEAGEFFETPPLHLQVDFDPAYASEIDTKETLALVDHELPTTYELLSLVSGWRQAGQGEDLKFLRDNSLLSANQEGAFDDKVTTGSWSLLSAFSKRTLLSSQFALSPSLKEARKAPLESLLVMTQGFLSKTAAYAKTQQAFPALLPGDDPWEGFRKVDDQANVLFDSRGTLKTILSLADQLQEKRNALAKTTPPSALKLRGASHEELLRRWARTDLPRITYLQWLKGVFADSQIGSSDEYPLLGEEHLDVAISLHSPEQLRHVSDVLGNARLVQHWDLKGFSNDLGLSSSLGEELNRSRRLLSRAYAYLAAAADLKQTGKDDSGLDLPGSVASRLAQAASCIAESRSVALSVLQELE